MMLRGFCSYCVGFIFSANVRDERPPLASGMAPAREADQQEACQKSRRDGGSLDRLVRILYSLRFKFHDLFMLFCPINLLKRCYNLIAIN